MCDHLVLHKASLLDKGELMRDLLEEQLKYLRAGKSTFLGGGRYVPMIFVWSSVVGLYALKGDYIYC